MIFDTEKLTTMDYKDIINILEGMKPTPHRMQKDYEIVRDLIIMHALDYAIDAIKTVNSNNIVLRKS